MEIVVIMVVLLWAGLSAEANKTKRKPVKTKYKHSTSVVRAKGEIFYIDGKKYYNDYTMGIREIK